MLPLTLRDTILFATVTHPDAYKSLASQKTLLTIDLKLRTTTTPPPSPRFSSLKRLPHPLGSLTLFCAGQAGLEGGTPVALTIALMLVACSELCEC